MHSWFRSGWSGWASWRPPRIWTRRPMLCMLSRALAGLRFPTRCSVRLCSFSSAACTGSIRTRFATPKPLPKRCLPARSSHRLSCCGSPRSHTRFLPCLHGIHGILLNLWGLSLVAGTALASCVLRVLLGRSSRWSCVLRRVSYVCAVGVVLLLGMHARFLAGVENNVAGASQAVPWYGVVIVLYAATSLVGLYVLGKAARREGWRGAVMGGFGCVLVFIATFLARLPFYFSYLSVGF